MKSVQDAVDLSAPAVMGIHGILARVTSETITMKDGHQHKLTTLTVTQGPPRVEVTINIWHPNHSNPEQVTGWEDMVHRAVDVTMLR